MAEHVRPFYIVIPGSYGPSVDVARSWPVGNTGGVIEIIGVPVLEGSGVTLGVEVDVRV